MHILNASCLASCYYSRHQCSVVYLKIYYCKEHDMCDLFLSFFLFLPIPSATCVSVFFFCSVFIFYFFPVVFVSTLWPCSVRGGLCERLVCMGAPSQECYYWGWAVDPGRRYGHVAWGKRLLFHITVSCALVRLKTLLKSHVAWYTCLCVSHV